LSPEVAITQLRTQFDGQVLGPNDDGYDAARKVFYAGLEDRRPAVILRAKSTRDVAAAVALARETGLELALKCGGHSDAGHSTTDGGILLDLGLRKGIQIDAASSTMWAESGLTAGEVCKAVGAQGFVLGFGDTGSVGIGGLTLGGGIGYLVRKYGLTIDSLLAVEVVTAEGQTLQVSETSHPDLFWAIRGGGGNFGVATRFRYRLAALPGVVSGMLITPATAETIAGFVSACEDAPEELSAIGNVMPCPPMPFVAEGHQGKLVNFALVAYAGGVEAAERALKRFRDLATPLADTIKPIPYAELYPDEEGYEPPLAASRTMFIDRVDRPVAQLILDRTTDHMKATSPVMAGAQLRVLGGAMARVPVEATAFAHRKSKILVNLFSLYTDEKDEAVHEGWVAGMMREIDQGDRGAYVNFLSRSDGPDRVRAAYPGATWDRLVGIKRRYDPKNLFRLNQNIPPAGQ
jgi:FAD/FMN-containing dehydrogenase